MRAANKEKSIQLRSPISLFAAYPSDHNLPAKVRVFLDLLLTRFGPDPYWDRDIFGEDGGGSNLICDESSIV